MHLELRTVELPYFVDGEFAYISSEFMNAIERMVREGRLANSSLTPQLTAYLRAKSIIGNDAMAWVIDKEKLHELIVAIDDLPDITSKLPLRIRSLFTRETQTIQLTEG